MFGLGKKEKEAKKAMGSVAGGEQLDFLAIGDIVTDAFIQLLKAHIEEEKGGVEELCMSWGDKLPYEKVDVVPAVGNSPNAAVSATRLGLKAALVTDIGNDDNGKDCLDALKKRGVDTRFVRVHPGELTNYHFVLRLGAERTILVKHTEFDYKFPQIEPGPKFMYLSSLASNSLPYHAEIVDYLKAHPETKLAFQPGTFQMKLGKDKLAELYKLSYLFFCNKEEAQRILGKREDDIKVLLKELRETGPEIVVITDGPSGAYVYDGKKVLWGPMYPDIAEPVDRTGAGDSFSSTFTSALALGESLETALRWGPVNSMSVVQYIGAQEGLLTREKLDEYLANAPEDYKVKEI